MVFAGLYPVDSDQYGELREALEKLERVLETEVLPGPPMVTPLLTTLHWVSTGCGPTTRHHTSRASAIPRSKLRILVGPPLEPQHVPVRRPTLAPPERGGQRVFGSGSLRG